MGKEEGSTAQLAFRNQNDRTKPKLYREARFYQPLYYVYAFYLKYTSTNTFNKPGEQVACFRQQRNN